MQPPTSLTSDLKTYTDTYLRLNQTEQELLDCVKRVRPSSQIITETKGAFGNHRFSKMHILIFAPNDKNVR